MIQTDFYLLLPLSRKKAVSLQKIYRMTEKELMEMRDGAEVTKVQFKERVLDKYDTACELSHSQIAAEVRWWLVSMIRQGTSTHCLLWKYKKPQICWQI